MKKAKQFKPKRPSGGKVFKGGKNVTGMYKTTEWKTYRFRFVHHNPSCYACGTNEGFIHLDHVVAHKGDEKIFWTTTNMISLCHSCHSTVTAKFDRYTPPRTVEKMRWIEIRRKETNTTIKIKIVPLKKGSGL